MAATKPGLKGAKSAPKKSVSRKSFIKVTVDERTAAMSTTAKKCRGRQHNWDEVPTESSRRLELIQFGQAEISEICSVCKSTRKTVIDAKTGDIIGSPQRTYSEDYLIGKEFKGSGRLPKREARKAYLVDLVPELRAA